MAKFDETTLTQLRDRFRSDFMSRTTSGDSVLRRSVENVMSFVVPGLTFGIYGAINHAARQIIPSEDSAIEWILRWADAFLTVPQKPATAATGSVTFTGTDTTVIPIGTEIANRDGATFTTNAQYVISGTSILGAVTGTEAGVAGNTLATASVFLSTPISGIDSEATVDSAGLSGGADIEDKLGVLSRLLARWKNPPRGGGVGDFKAWAEEIASVTRAFEFRQDPNTGWVKVVIVDDTSGPVPGAATIAAAQANVDLRRPIMMGGSTVIGPTPQTLNLTWLGLIPDSPGTRTALEANTDAWVLANGEPGLALRQPDIEDAGQEATGVAAVSLSVPTADADPGQYGMFTTIKHAYV